MALMLTLAQSGERILLPSDGYYNTRGLAARLRHRGVGHILVDLLDLPAIEESLKDRPTVLWAETPGNPPLTVADLGALGKVAADAGAPMVVDNTVATGVLQKPLEHGALASVYSLTKAISGHSDLVLGAVVTRDRKLLDALRAWRKLGGAIPGPFESWLPCAG